MTAYSKASKLRQNGRLPELLSGLTWYALLVPPQKEFAAQDVLKRFGIASFCPFEVVFRHRSAIAKARGEEKVERRQPWMPRYVFAGFSAPPPWWALFNLPILRGVVGIEGEPAPIGNMLGFIGKFKNGLRRPDEEKFMRTHHEYKAGDLACVVEGAWRDRVVTVDEIKNGHALFKLEFLGGERIIQLPLDFLEAA